MKLFGSTKSNIIKDKYSENVPKTFLKGEYANLACSIIYLWIESKIYSPIRYSYLSIFPDDNADIFAASPLILYRIFPLILLLIVMISFYIISKRFFLKHKGLSDARVASITKKEYGFAVNFLKKFVKFLKSISDEWLNAICWSPVSPIT